MIVGSLVACADTPDTRKVTETKPPVKEIKQKKEPKQTKESEKKLDKEDRRLIEYVKRAISVNKDFKLDSIDIRQKKELEDLPGWYIYFLDIRLALLKQKGKKIVVHDKIFSNGKYVVRDFINMVNNASLKDRLVPDMDPALYDKKHLLYGKMDAPNKIVAFSDPICPFCQTYMPKLLKAAKEHPDKIALFYYHFPLVMLHKEAPTVIKAMIAAQKKGEKEIIRRVYEKRFSMDTTDEKKILDAFNKALGTHITLEDIHSKEIERAYSEDLEAAGRLMISGTPTIYVNGTKDFTRQKYKKIIGEK